MNCSEKSLGLYLHIPFCRQKCAYCDFYSLPACESAHIEAYVRALCDHLSKTAQHTRGHRVDSIYFGGGTPSYLEKTQLITLLKHIFKHYSVSSDAEITLEANPDSIGDEKRLIALREAGFNRISLGMQSACDKELQEIGRIHTARQTRDAVHAIRAANIQNLSLDLIYGLPHQNMERWQENLAAAIALDPEHISCYGLKVEPGTLLASYAETAQLPGDDLQADMYLYAVETLRRSGYEQYEISNFAKPGYTSRHNMKYWTLGEYLGFGPGAHSDFGGVRCAYEKDMKGYTQSLQDGTPVFSEYERIPLSCRDTEWIMLGLRTTYGLDPQVFESLFHRPFNACFLPFLSRCEKEGYAVCEASRWHLTPQGFLVSNQIIGAMLDLLSADKRKIKDTASRGDFYSRTD